MPPSDSPREAMQEWIEEYLQRLIDLSRDRTEAEKAAGRIRVLLKTSEKIDPGSVAGRFTKYTQAKDAILDLLDERGHALTEEEIVSEVKAGGFKQGKEDVDKDIRKCTGAYRPSARLGRKALRWVGDKIGRGEWPEDRFK